MNAVRGFFIIILLLLWIVSCTDKNNKEGYKNIEFTIDTLHIEVDLSSPNNYLNFSTFKNKENITFFGGYNHTMHSIDIYNLSHLKFEKRISLNRNGPEAIVNIDGFHIHNLDSIFVFDNQLFQLFIIDDESNIVTKFNFLNIFRDEIWESFPVIDHHFRLYYNSKANCILFRNHYNEPYKNDISFVSIFSLDSLTLTSIPFFHTENFLSKGEFGYLCVPTISKPYDNKVFLNQVYSPITYSLDLVNYNIVQVPVVSSMVHKPLLDQSIPYAPEIHATENAFYNQLEKISDTYYTRIIWDKADFNVKVSNPLLEKSLKLDVYDIQFNYLNEIPLGEKSYYQYSWFNIDSSLYLQPLQMTYSNTLKEGLFTLHKITLY